MCLKLTDLDLVRQLRLVYLCQHYACDHACASCRLSAATWATIALDLASHLDHSSLAILACAYAYALPCPCQTSEQQHPGLWPPFSYIWCQPTNYHPRLSLYQYQQSVARLAAVPLQSAEL